MVSTGKIPGTGHDPSIGPQSSAPASKSIESFSSLSSSASKGSGSPPTSLKRQQAVKRDSKDANLSTRARTSDAALSKLSAQQGLPNLAAFHQRPKASDTNTGWVTASQHKESTSTLSKVRNFFKNGSADSA